MDSNFTSNIVKIFTAAHKDFEGIFYSFPYRFFLTIFAFVYVVSLGLSVLNAGVDPTNQLNFAQGVGFTVLGIIISIPIALIFVFIEIYLVHLLTHMFQGELSIKDSGKIYIIALVPGTIMSIITSLGMVLLILISVLGESVYTFTSVGYNFLTFPITLIILTLRYYVLINGVKSIGKLDTFRSIVTGCLPTIILMIILGIIACILILLFWGVLVAAFGLG